MRSVTVARSIGSIVVVLGLIGIFDANQNRDDRLLYELVPALIALGPSLVALGVILLVLPRTQTKKTASHWKLFAAGVIMLVIPVVVWIKVALGPPETDAGWGMVALVLAIYVGGPGLVLVIAALVLMSLSDH